VFLGWSETKPQGIFRSWTTQLMREDQWDFGGLATRSNTQLEAHGTFQNKWGAQAQLSYQDVVDTRMLRGGPALRWHELLRGLLAGQTDPSRRVSAKLSGSHAAARDDDSTHSMLEAP